MSDISIIESQRADGRDQATGQFIKGYRGGGRPKGARNRVGERFLEDLQVTWERRGIEALEKCAIEEPGTFCKIVASLLPKDVNLNIGINWGELHSREEILAAVVEEKGEQAALLLEQLIALDAPVTDEPPIS